VRIVSEEEHLRFLKIEPAIAALKSGQKENARKLLRSELRVEAQALDRLIEELLEVEKREENGAQSYVEVIDRFTYAPT
jgi:signal transduction histidine kinase